MSTLAGLSGSFGMGGALLFLVSDSAALGTCRDGFIASTMTEDLSMIPTDTRLQKIRDAETQRRRMRKAIAEERQLSQISGFIMTLAEALDDWVPFGVASAVGRAVLRRRIRRREASLITI